MGATTLGETLSVKGLSLEAQITEIRDMPAIPGIGIPGIGNLGIPAYLLLHLKHDESTNLIPNEHYPPSLDLYPFKENIGGVKELYKTFQERDGLTLTASARRVNPENRILRGLHRLKEKIFGDVYEFTGQLSFKEGPSFLVSFDYVPHSLFTEIKTLQPISLED